MKSVTINKDLAAGAVFVAFGAFFALSSLSLPIGTAFRMGPGFMPLMLGVILACLGLIVAITGWRKVDEGMLKPSWRGIVLITVAVVFFGLCVRGLGFVPTVAITAATVALSSKSTTIVGVVLTSAVLTVMCVAIFIFGLGVQIPLLGPWLGVR